MHFPSLLPFWVPHLLPVSFWFPLTWDLMVAPVGATGDWRLSLSQQRGECPFDKRPAGSHGSPQKSPKTQTLCTVSSNRCQACGGQGLGLGSHKGICDKWPERLELDLFFKESNSQVPIMFWVLLYLHRIIATTLFHRQENWEHFLNSGFYSL